MNIPRNVLCVDESFNQFTLTMCLHVDMQHKSLNVLTGLLITKCVASLADFANSPPSCFTIYKMNKYH